MGGRLSRHLVRQGDPRESKSTDLSFHLTMGEPLGKRLCIAGVCLDMAFGESVIWSSQTSDLRPKNIREALRSQSILMTQMLKPSNIRELQGALQAVSH